jgi:hypothetical protein
MLVPMGPALRLLLGAALSSALLALAACGSKSGPGPVDPEPPPAAAPAPGPAAPPAPSASDLDHRVEILCIKYTGAYCDDDGVRQTPFAALPRETQQEVLEECRELLGRRTAEVLDAAEACLACETDCVAIDGCLAQEPPPCEDD